jgi:cell filamentation protein
MKNNYKYIDPDSVYSDPKTGTLRNLAGIDDQELLSAFESLKVAGRAEELRARPIPVESSDALFAVHRHLFQDVYAWAGQRRTVEISKGGRQFFPVSRFDTALTFIDGLIADYKRLPPADKTALARKLAEILDAVNFLHPFREGNGRTQREFLRLLALEKGWKLHLNPPDDAEAYERYMTGTINGDVPGLADLIAERMTSDGKGE